MFWNAVEEAHLVNPFEHVRQVVSGATSTSANEKSYPGEWNSKLRSSEEAPKSEVLDTRPLPPSCRTPSVSLDCSQIQLLLLADGPMAWLVPNPI